MANAHAGNGVCRNVCLERNSIFLSCSKVRHLHGITGNKEKDESTDDGGNLRQQFKDHGVSFCFLYHQLGQYGEVVENKKNQQQGTVVNETYISHSEEEDQPSISAEPLSHEQENENMYGYAMSHREKSSNGVDEHLWIALAYVTPQSRCLFRLYPHVLKFDVTMGSTNEEKRPLLIVSGRTPWGENFIIMRAYLPN